jgi:hypothetical protein
MIIMDMLFKNELRQFLSIFLYKSFEFFKDLYETYIFFLEMFPFFVEYIVKPMVEA